MVFPKVLTDDDGLYDYFSPVRIESYDPESEKEKMNEEVRSS